MPRSGILLSASLRFWLYNHRRLNRQLSGGIGRRSLLGGTICVCASLGRCPCVTGQFERSCCPPPPPVIFVSLGTVAAEVEEAPTARSLPALHRRGHRHLRGNQPRNETDDDRHGYPQRPPSRSGCASPPCGRARRWASTREPGAEAWAQRTHREYLAISDWKIPSSWISPPRCSSAFAGLNSGAGVMGSDCGGRTFRSAMVTTKLDPR